MAELALTLEQSALIDAEALKIPAKRAAKWSGSTLTRRDDLLSAGRLGLALAAQTFDPSKGAAFSTWATYCVDAEMQSEIRQSKRETGNHQSMASLAGMVERSTPESEGAIRGFDCWKCADQGADTVSAIDMLSLLDDQACDVVLRHTINGETVREIAADMGVSPSAIQEIWALAIKTLRGQLNRDDMRVNRKGGRRRRK